jgi:hypothetical protein
MTGEAHWLTPLIVLFGAALWVAIAYLARRAGGYIHEVHLRLDCPKLARPVDVTAIRNFRSGEWTQVMHCSAFEPAELPGCRKACLETLNEAVPLRAA